MTAVRFPAVQNFFHLHVDTRSGISFPISLPTLPPPHDMQPEYNTSNMGASLYLPLYLRISALHYK